MLFVPLLLSAALVLAAPAKRQSVAFIAPNANGGSNLDVATSDGLGEPLNVIVSALSSAAVLTDDGFLNWLQSINLSTECLGLHLGDPQTANLGDGQGFVDQVQEYREDFGNTDLGTCLESLIGGNHLRMWRQSTTGALFLAVSHEEDLDEGHTISPDGYNLGRDTLVSSAIAGSSHNGVTYTATVESVSGLLTPGTTGVNHDISQDGIVKVLTVTIV
ncbi:hypothetical protein EXIGLDRAFT_378971 [Exidia glandulosa HHB12029]|uniref:Uncharacterized protein n=1 Tax=Exidia glandulosa HHB12029 TaxID=1314781 RepID=A0A165L587_EXIGL|nr:hypothetical protein EXIGLDRAFT_378971 [Exidia glandulosa HHB12029]